ARWTHMPSTACSFDRVISLFRIIYGSSGAKVPFLPALTISGLWVLGKVLLSLNGAALLTRAGIDQSRRGSATPLHSRYFHGWLVMFLCLFEAQENTSQANLVVVVQRRGGFARQFLPV